MADRDDELRALLEDAVSDIEPRPGLDRIHARTRVSTMRTRRPWLYAAAGAVVATAATLVAVIVVADRGDDATTAGPAGTSRSPSPVASATGGTRSPSGSAQSPAPSASSPQDEETVPVYYVADTNTGPRLFREFHRVYTDSPVQGAVGEALSENALDPDYFSPWADLGAQLRTADVSAHQIPADLAGSGLHDRPAGMSQDEAEAAVQQLVYSAQAAVQDRKPVQLLLDGRHTDTLLGVPVAEPLAEADPMQVQGTVWVIGPQDGDTVGRTFTVEGRGAFFEANVSWQLLQDGQVVKEGHGMAQECCVLSPYRFTVRNVEPGAYTLRVYDADMSGGEGNGEAEDTKQITVE